MCVKLKELSPIFSMKKKSKILIISRFKNNILNCERIRGITDYIVSNNAQIQIIKTSLLLF